MLILCELTIAGSWQSHTTATQFPAHQPSALWLGWPTSSSPLAPEQVTSRRKEQVHFTGDNLIAACPHTTC